MRITSKMMTNNMMSNINKNKYSLNELDNQYTSGKKIQRPSDDPVIAIRALKLRSTMTELNQYLEKNIPDAISWMDVTEGALTNMNTILTNMNTYCNQGSNDPLSVSDRDTIAENLKQLKEQLYKECNANYAGRYVFSGYKTNNSVTFETVSQKVVYNIDEDFSGEDIEQISKVIGGYTTGDYDSTAPDKNEFAKAPQLVENLYRLRLSYDNIDDIPMTTDDIKYTVEETVTNPDGSVTKTQKLEPISKMGISVRNSLSINDDAYIPADNEIVYLKDTGELIMGADIYEKLRLQKDSGIVVSYQKTNFSVGDYKPEHLFNCKTTDDLGNEKTYTKMEQDIEYEINFSQSMRVNTQISDVFGTEVTRDIDEIMQTIIDVQDVEDQIENVDKLLSNVDLTVDQKDALNALKGQLSTELVLKTKVMTNAFENGLGKTTLYQSSLNIAIADLGSRYSRVELTQSRMETQKDDYTELLSNNEDADMVETFIKLSAADTVYTSSLGAVSKIMDNSLMDFI